MTLRSEVKAVMTRAGNFLEYLEKKEEVEELAAILDESTGDEVRVLMYGIYDAGKSTLINALVGREVAEENASPTDHEIEAHPFRDGIKLIDSPGLDSTYFKQHEDRAMQALKQSDLVLFCISSKGGFEEKRVWIQLAEIHDTMGKPVAIVVNDKKQEGLSNIISEVKKKRDAFLDEKVPVFTVDGREAKESKMSGVLSDLSRTGIEALESYIVDTIAMAKQKLKLSTPLSAAAMMLKALEFRTQDEVIKARDNKLNEVRQLETELKQLRDQAGDSVERKVDDLREMIISQATSLFSHIEAHGDKGIEDVAADIEKEVQSCVIAKQQIINTELTIFEADMKALVRKLPMIRHLDSGEGGTAMPSMAGIDFEGVKRDWKDLLREGIEGSGFPIYTAGAEKLIDKGIELGLIKTVEKAGGKVSKKVLETAAKKGDKIIKVGSRGISKKMIAKGLGIGVAVGTIIGDYINDMNKKKEAKQQIQTRFKNYAAQVTDTLVALAKTCIVGLYGKANDLVVVQKDLIEKESENELKTAVAAHEIISRIDALLLRLQPR